MPSIRWILFTGIGASLFAFGSFVLHYTISQEIRFNMEFFSYSPWLNLTVAIATMAWGLEFIVRGLRQMMLKYSRINRLIVIGGASLLASVVTASLSITNYLQYLEDKAGLQRCVESLCFASSKFNPIIYYHDFITYSIAGGILGIIGAALLFANWKGKNSHTIALGSNQ